MQVLDTISELQMLPDDHGWLECQQELLVLLDTAAGLATGAAPMTVPEIFSKLHRFRARPFNATVLGLFHHQT